jgi:hypothetical protein
MGCSRAFPPLSPLFFLNTVHAIRRAPRHPSDGKVVRRKPSCSAAPRPLGWLRNVPLGNRIRQSPQRSTQCPGHVSRCRRKCWNFMYEFMLTNCTTNKQNRLHKRPNSCTTTPNIMYNNTQTHVQQPSNLVHKHPLSCT